MKKFILAVLAAAALGLVIFVKIGTGPVPPPPLPPPTTPEERAFVRDAHRIGTRLYAVSKRADEQGVTLEVQQERLKPVYEQIEDFIFQRLSQHSNQVSSIVVFYNDPDIQCTIYVKHGTEEELKQIKRTADTCVGRIVENLPIVRYLTVRHEE